MHEEVRRNPHEFQIMMLKMMSSLQPSPLASLQPETMAVPQFILANQPIGPNNSAASSAAQLASVSLVPTPRTTLDEDSAPKPIAPTSSMETDDRYSVEDALEFKVEPANIEPERTLSFDNDVAAGSPQ